MLPSEIVRYSSLATILTGLTLSPCFGSELLPNPGFEGTYSSGVAPSWIAASIDTRSLSQPQEVAEGRTGKAQSIRVTKKLGGFSGLQHSFITRINGTTGLERGKDYEASLWVRADRRDLTFSIGISDNTAWQPKTFATSHHVADHAWQRVVFRFRASDIGTDGSGNPLNQNGSIYFYIRLWNEGQLVVDDASFRLLSPADYEPAPVGNLIRNASFEAATDGWQGWNTTPSSQSEANAPHGGYALSLNANGQSSSRLQSWSFPLAWGPSYTLSLWMRANSSTTIPVWVARAGTAFGEAATAVATQDFNVTTEWVRYSFSFTPPPLPRGRAFLVIDPPNTGTVWIDAVQLEAGNLPSTFSSKRPIEAALVLDRTSVVYAPGEVPSAQLIIANHGSPALLSLQRVVKDIHEAPVSGSTLSWNQSLNSGRTQLPVTLPVGSKLGAFRAEFAVADETVADNTFVVLPEGPEPGETSGVGTHLDFSGGTLPRAAGAGWTKSWYLNWNQQESTAEVWNYPFSSYFTSWQAAGLKTLAVLGGPPTYRQNRPANALSWGWYPPADLARAQDYARRMGERFGDRVAAWELCNEPDVFLHNNGYTNGPEAYAAETLAYATGLLEVIPNAEILVGSATVDRSPEIWIGAALSNERTNSQGKKLRDLVTGVSFHNYEADPAVTRRLTADIRNKLVELASTLGMPRLATLPIWDTEWSPLSHPVSFRKEEPRILRGLSGSSARQNAGVTAIGIISRAGEGVNAGFLYHSYGPATMACGGDGHDILHEFDSRPRPTLAAQAAAISLLNGARSPESLNVAGIWGYRFVRDDARTLHAFWTDQRESLPVMMAAPEEGELFDLFGNKIADVTLGQMLTVPFEPVYLLGDTFGLQVSYGERVIAAGDFTPSVEDGTEFGEAEANAIEMAVERSYSLTNVGSNSLAFPSGAVLSGVNPGDWSVVTPLPASLNPGQSSTLVVRFAPTAIGTRSAILELPTLAGTLRFGLAGEGTVPLPNAASSVSQISESLAPGEAPMDRTITLSNLGRGALTWSAGVPQYYTFANSTTAGGPVYSWYAPAEGRGTLINFRNSTDSSNISNSVDRDDYMSELLELGFDMPYFGQRHSRIRITTNGVLTFNTTIAFPSYINTNLPSSSAPNQTVFVLWDDLYLVGNVSQAYWFKPDADTFVVSWHDVAYYNDKAARQTFQVVLHRDGRITTQYATVARSPNTNGFCIGLQNQNSSAQALLYSRTPTPPSNSLAVAFTPPSRAASEGVFTPGAPSSWATLVGSASSGTLSGATAINLVVRFDATNLVPGLTYRTRLSIASNDPDQPTMQIPVSLVVATPPPPRIPSGDLVGYWRMDALAAGVSADSSGAGRHLNAVGTTGLNAQGRFGGALQFDGALPTGSGPATGAHLNSPAVSAFTFSAWVFLDGEGGNPSARYPRVIELPGLSLLLRRNSSENSYGGIGFNAAFNGSSGDWRTEAGLMTTGRWYHIAVTYDASATSNAPQFFLDGTLRQTVLLNAPSGSALASSGTGWIGNRPDGQRPLHGRIDHARLFARVLSAAEISALAADAGHALEGTLRGDWRYLHWGAAADSPESLDTADPDNDGMSNLLEYALDLDPLVSDPLPWEWEAVGNRLRLRFSRIADPSLVYQVEGASILGVFAPIWQSSGAQNLSGWVEVEDVEYFGDSTARFLRLRVSAP